MPAYKVASFENTDIPLIRKIAATGKPMIISTGMASVAELDESVAAARAAGCRDLVLLKCTSTYPATPQNTNLRTIPHLRELFGCEVGLSDHTMGVGAAVAAVALGAALSRIEGVRPQRRDPRMDSQGNYCYVFHYDPAHFAGLSLRRFEAALAAEGVPMTVSYPSLSELDLFKSGDFGPRLRESARRIETPPLPRAEHAARSTVWLQHRLLLGREDQVLAVARAVERLQRHASRLNDRA